MKPRYTLYLTSTSPRAPIAAAAVRSCIGQLTGGHEGVEVVHADQDVTRANEDRVVATPMLVRRGAGRELRIVGIPRSAEELLRLLDGGHLSPRAQAA